MRPGRTIPEQLKQLELDGDLNLVFLFFWGVVCFLPIHRLCVAGVSCSWGFAWGHDAR